MPELPEVETVKNGLLQQLGKVVQIDRIKLLRKDLRFPIPQSLTRAFKGQKILTIERRAKFLLFKTSEYTLISHLGMTGTWRISEEDRKHDHIHIFLTSGKRLVYNDPRRFGVFDYCKNVQLKNYIGFKNFGPEPFDSKNFNDDYFVKYCKTKSAPIKNIIMKQEFVVGVGNIYACEALFKAGVRPQKCSKQVSKAKLLLLKEKILEVLQQAIAAGGSSIGDFKKSDGSEGYFQHSFLVYGREGELCHQCKTSKIKNIRLAGRSSFYCPKCQN